MVGIPKSAISCVANNRYATYDDIGGHYQSCMWKIELFDDLCSRLYTSRLVVHCDSSDAIALCELWCEGATVNELLELAKQH